MLNENFFNAGMVQIDISKLNFDFRAYADKHFNRMAEMIRDARYERWLEEFEIGEKEHS